jgi:hypothetical protein
MIVDDDSKELLEFSKLTPEGFNTTAMSTCCGTLMCGTHPLYEGTTISVNADSCRITTPSCFPVQAVVFASDCPKEPAEKMLQNSSVPILFSVHEEMESPTMQEFLAAVTEPISEGVAEVATTSFEELSAARPIIVDNAFFEESRGILK